MLLRVAKSEEEITRCRRLWYDVYVSEMGRHVEEADHENHLLVDERDRHGRLFYLSDNNGDVVGTVLATLGRTCALGYYEEIYQMSESKNGIQTFHPYRTAICTKLILDKRIRGTSAVIKLSNAAYAYGLLHGVRFNFADCREFMLRAFHRMGYRTHAPEIDHPKYGKATCIIFDLEDEKHLIKVASPLLRILQYWLGRTAGDFSEEEALFNQLMRY